MNAERPRTLVRRGEPPGPDALLASMAMTDFWHPFADMAKVEADGALTIVRGEGACVFDDSGRRYLDATASLWYCNVGWGRDEIAEAAAAQMRELPAYSTFGDLTNRSRRGPGRTGRAHGPGPRLQGVPHQRRLRLDRHRHEDGAPLLAAPRGAASARS